MSGAQQGWRSAFGASALGGLSYKGTWNANTNLPTLGNGGSGGVNGDYYVVNVAGTTSIDGVNDWGVGDWIINNGTTWQKIDNSDSVTSVNGLQGAVQLGLADILAENNATGAYDISINSGQGVVYNNGGFTNTINTSVLTANQTISFPDNSGVVALISDLPVTIYSGNGTVGTNRVLTLTDTIRTDVVIGTKTIQSGMGIDPIAFAYNGILSYMYNTPASREAWGGLLDLSGEPTWWHEVYSEAFDSAGTFVGYSSLQLSPYSSIYHYGDASGTYNGFEANLFGEQLYSQRTSLVTTALTSADRVLFVSNAGGYIKATTYADLVAQLNVPTLYSANGSTVGARTVTLGGALQFNHGVAGVNGYVQMLNNGYFFNQTSTVGNYFEYNGSNGAFSVRSQSHTVTGFRAFRLGTSGNPTAELNLMAGSNGNCYLDLAPTVPIFFFLTNNTATIAGSIYGSNGAWGIGGFAETSSSLLVTGKGNTSATNSQRWTTLGGSEVARMTDDGGLAIGINTLTGGFANASRLRVDATVTADYTSSVVFDQTYNNGANNTNSAGTLTTRLYKASSFSINDMKSAYFQTRNDGTGSMGMMYGIEGQIWNIGNASIGSAFAISARAQVRAGSYTLYGGVDVSFQEVGGGTIANMIGMIVRSPVNVSGLYTITNTYGVLLQANTLGTNNYGFYQQNSNARNYMEGNLSIGISLAPSTTKFQVRGTGATIATINSVYYDSSLNALYTLTDNGNVGHNIAPTALDRMYIRAGSGYNGAINISAFNLANGGYSILAQGGLGGAGTYNGIWSDAIGGATLDNRAFFGISGISGAQNSIGGEFRARNGSQYSIGVWGRAIGGDAVNPTQQAIGVWGEIASLVPSFRFALRATIFQAGTTNLAVSNGLDINIQYASTVANETPYGIYTLVRVDGAGVVNRGAFFQASGGGGAVNHALVTTGGNIGFGTASPNASAIVEISSLTQGLLLPRMNATQASAIVPVNGLVIYVTSLNATFITIGFWGYENGAWVKL
jgi:hypothetical protein